MYMYMYITFIYIIKYSNVFNVHFPLSVPVPVIDFSCSVVDGKWEEQTLTTSTIQLTEGDTDLMV